MFRVFIGKSAVPCALALALCGSIEGAHAGGLNVLYNFPGGSAGALPTGALLADSAGNLYGATIQGGITQSANCIGDGGCGTVFSIAPNGTETVIYAFAGGTDDGISPNAGVIADKAGNLYGTTLSGGAGNLGIVFKIAPNGTEQVLHAFVGGNDGASPQTGLIMDKKGNLYGTTGAGGTGPCQNGCGTVFSISPKGVEKVIYSFQWGNDGLFPVGGLIEIGTTLYGTTAAGGGATNCGNGVGCGTVFSLTTKGKEKVLYSFQGGSDGSYPTATLIADKKGNLYGTTETGGGGTNNCGVGSGECGSVFKLSATGTETVLYAFTGGSDGATPFGGLIADKKGDLYGTTSRGADTYGVVFKLTPGGTETVLHTFEGFPGSDGGNPNGTLIADKKGNLYGLTQFGGSKDVGTVFTLPE